MADSIGLYVKTGTPESGGTNAYTGLVSTTGLTRISIAGAAPFSFPALDTVYTLYYKVEDDSTFLDVTKDTTAAFTITCPTGVVACKTYDGTFESAPTDIPVAVGGLKPVYVKQTARQASASADLEVGTGGVTFTTGTRLEAPTLSASGDADSIVLTIGALTGEDGFEVQRATDSGFTANLTTLTSTLAADSTTYDDTTASVGTTYHYRVRGWNENGVGAWSTGASSSATVIALYAGTATIQTAGATGTTIGSGDMCRTPAGDVYVSYINMNTVWNVRVAHSHDGGATWASEFPDADTTNAHGNPVMTCDNDGTVHVLYAEDNMNSTSLYGLKRAYGTAGSWTVETVLNPPSYDVTPHSILADDSDNLHILYRYNSNIYYMLGTKSGATWSWGSPETVLDTTDTATRAKLALDDDGYPYVVVGETTGSDIWFSHRRTGSWSGPAEIATDSIAAAVCFIYAEGSSTSATVLVGYMNASSQAVVLKSTDGGANFSAYTRTTDAISSIAGIVKASSNLYHYIGSKTYGSYTEAVAIPFTPSTGAFGTLVKITDSSSANQAILAVFGQHLPTGSGRHNEVSAGYALAFISYVSTNVAMYHGSSSVVA